MLSGAKSAQRAAGRSLAALVGLRGLLALLVSLAGCASQPQVQSLATGRSDVSAHTLTGTDLDTLRREAQRLCPLGGEILRQSGQPQPVLPTAGRWRALLDVTTQWVNAVPISAQLVVLCHEPGDRFRLPAATLPATAASRTSAALSGDMPRATAALPVGPITPEW